MRSRYLVHQPHLAHFVTCTVVEWIPVFTSEARCQVLADSLAWCQAHKGLRIHAWVILDNHFHAILSADDLSRVMADLKRHTTKQLLSRFVDEGADWLLKSAHLLPGKT